MATGQVGSVTAAVEALAAAVGAGMLLGGFVAGSIGIAAGWSHPSLDRWVVLGTYFGGSVGVGLAAFDLFLRYGM
jgi:hypothetical protein